MYDIVKDRGPQKDRRHLPRLRLETHPVQRVPRRYQRHTTAGIGGETDRPARQSGREDRSPRRLCERLRQTNCYRGDWRMTLMLRHSYNRNRVFKKKLGFSSSFGTLLLYEEPSMNIRVSDIKQYFYCPRVVYHTYYTPVTRPTTHPMQIGAGPTRGVERPRTASNPLSIRTGHW